MRQQQAELRDLIRMQKEVLVDLEKDLGARAIILKDLGDKQDTVKHQIADAKLEIKILEGKLRRL